MLLYVRFKDFSLKPSFLVLVNEEGKLTGFSSGWTTPLEAAPEESQYLYVYTLKNGKWQGEWLEQQYGCFLEASDYPAPTPLETTPPCNWNCEHCPKPGQCDVYYE